MPGITLDIASSKLTTWLAAEEFVALGQAFTTDSGRSLTRANLSDIRAQIDYWQRHVTRLEAAAAGSARQRPVIVYDA